MAVDVQLLVGAAVTVFLALLFFGVVVLWDVALALRSVGDKIDKLEDNIDDDLMNIGHTLDGMSHGSNDGGTQFHLSGGTISSGPAPGQAQEQPAQATQPQAGADGTQTPQQPQHQHQPAQQPSQASGAGSVEGPDPTVDPATEAEHPASDTAATSDDEPPTDGDDAEPLVDEDGAGSTTDEDEPTGDETGGEPEPAHPRAATNRGRFITSPDRTAWYTVPLDRDAIHAVQPSIAGELTDGSDSSIDESEIIAAGPVESAEIETDTAAATAESESDDVTSDQQSNEADFSDRSSETTEATPAETDTHGDDSETVASDAETDEDNRDDDSPLAETDAFAFDENEESVDSQSPATEADAVDSTANESTDASADEPDEQPPAATGTEPLEESDREVDNTDREVDEADRDDRDVDTTETDDRSDALERPATESDADELDEADDSEPPVEDETEAETETEQPIGGDVAAFEFEDDSPEDADVTVEEAVETINEDAPATELSSHQFDVTAAVHERGEDGDGDSAVLEFTFDSDTVDISGSTKRLLQYQMRSFADRDSTPDGDVTIGQQRIVIEIPDSDGNAVQHWGEAAVSIIDRTLYLSDNSSDDS